MPKLPLLGAFALLVAAVALLAWPSGVAAQDPVNIVDNGGFEAGELDGWTVVDWDGSFANGTWCPQSGTLAPGITDAKGGVICGFDGPIKKGPLPEGLGSGGSGATVEPPPEGEIAAMMDQDRPSSSVMYQCVDIPSTATSAELSFQLYLLNVEGKVGGEYFSPPTLDPFIIGKPKPLGQAFPLGNGTQNQQFRADVVTTGGMDGDPFTLAEGDVLMNVYQTDPGDPNESGYDPVTADLSSLAGQSVCIRFALVDNVFYFNAGVDDVKLLVQEGDEPTPTGTPPGGGVDVTVEDETVGVGDDVDVTATVTDDEGNPIEGEDCTFEIIDQPGDDATVEAGPVATDASGEATTTLHAGTTPGSIQVEATCGVFTEVLDVIVSPAELPATGVAGEPDGAPAWAVAFAIGLTAIGLSALTMRAGRVKS